MKAFVIAVSSQKENACKVSQTAFKTLQQAQAFCASRADKPQQHNQYTYKSADTTYWICEINIEGG